MDNCHSGRSLLWTGDEEQLAILCSLLQSIRYFRSRPHLSKAARLLSLFSSRLRPCQLLAVDTHIHGALCRCGSFFADPPAESFKVRQLAFSSCRLHCNILRPGGISFSSRRTNLSHSLSIPLERSPDFLRRHLYRSELLAAGAYVCRRGSSRRCSAFNRKCCDPTRVTFAPPGTRNPGSRLYRRRNTRANLREQFYR